LLDHVECMSSLEKMTAATFDGRARAIR
jgi:hypothetical protein